MTRPSIFVLVLAFTLLSSHSNALEIVAFKGLHQSVRRDLEVGRQDCTAHLLHQESHPYLENTIAGIQAAFELGATIGHFNIQKTQDNDLIAFHDATLECRTNGQGLVSNAPLSLVKTLDPGFGYSWDHGETFPLRGKWTGHIPTVHELIRAFPNRRFVINNKNSDVESVELLAKVFQKYPDPIQKNFFYAGENNAKVRELLPQMNVLISKAQMKQCLRWWFATGWSGYVHSSCADTTLILRVKDLKAVYFPAAAFSRFAKRARSQFWILEVDAQEDAKYVRSLSPDFVGTYRIDKTVTALTRSKDK